MGAQRPSGIDSKNEPSVIDRGRSSRADRSIRRLRLHAIVLPLVALLQPLELSHLVRRVLAPDVLRRSDGSSDGFCAWPWPGALGAAGGGPTGVVPRWKAYWLEPFRATAVTWPRTPSATNTPRRSVSPEKNDPLPRTDHLDLDLRHERLGPRVPDRHADPAAVGLLQHLELQRRDEQDPRGVAVVAADHHEVGPFAASPGSRWRGPSRRSPGRRRA